MAIMDIIRKINDGLTPKKTGGKPMHPAEIELASFEERERMDNVKKRLEIFRKKNSDEMFRGTPMSDDNSILKKELPKHSLSSQKNTILAQDNTLLKAKNIFKGGGFL